MTDTAAPAPALTPEEWRDALHGKNRSVADYAMFADAASVTANFGSSYDEVIEGKQRHALAALCLYQQPFGFTHEDVKLLEDFAAVHRDWPNDKAIDFASKLSSIALRIKHLLPPSSSPE